MAPDVIIVGAGVAGLSAAHALTQAGVQCQVLEARARIGGRIESVPGYTSVDLGPAWFWPHHEHLARALKTFSLDSFTQPATGDTMIDRGPQQAPQRTALPDAEGPPYRIAGGVSGLVGALVEGLDRSVRTRAPVTHVERQREGVRLRLASGEEVPAGTCVLALPPEVIGRTITFGPTLPAELTHLLAHTPTWMSWSMKVALVYARAHWREAGLSGAAISRHGPVLQFYDAAEPHGEGPAALVGWVDPAQARALPPQAHREAVEAQAARLFGDVPPIAYAARDWSAERWTAPPGGLPSGTTTQLFGHHVLRDPQWEGRLHFAGSETSATSPGYLDGALARGAQLARTILDAGR